MLLVSFSLYIVGMVSNCNYIVKEVSKQQATLTCKMSSKYIQGFYKDMLVLKPVHFDVLKNGLVK